MPSRGRVAVPLADGFDDDEFETVLARLREAGYQVHVIGAGHGTELVGRNHHVRVTVDRDVADIRSRDYVGLVLVHAGPYGLEDLPGIAPFVAAFDRFERPTLVFATSSPLLPSAPADGQPITHRIRSTSPATLEQACWAFIDQLERGITDGRSPALPRARATSTAGILPGAEVEFPWNVL